MCWLAARGRIKTMLVDLWWPNGAPSPRRCCYIIVDRGRGCNWRTLITHNRILRVKLSSGKRQRPNNYNLLSSYSPNGDDRTESHLPKLLHDLFRGSLAAVVEGPATWSSLSAFSLARNLFHFHKWTIIIIPFRCDCISIFRYLRLEMCRVVCRATNYRACILYREKPLKAHRHKIKLLFARLLINYSLRMGTGHWPSVPIASPLPASPCEPHLGVGGKCEQNVHWLAPSDAVAAAAPPPCRPIHVRCWGRSPRR